MFAHLLEHQRLQPFPKEGATGTAPRQIKIYPHLLGLICRMAHDSQPHCVPGLIIRCLFQYFPGNCSLRIKAPAYRKRALHKDSGVGAREEQ